MLTDCTFDGIVYDVGRVMGECLAIRPDLVFLWDEAWFAFASIHPVYRPRTAVRASRTPAERLRSPEYSAATRPPASGRSPGGSAKAGIPATPWSTWPTGLRNRGWQVPACTLTGAVSTARSSASWPASA